MTRYEVPVELTIEANIQSSAWLPLVRTIHRFNAIKDNLKGAGMKFKLTPNSFFHTELPVSKTHYYFDYKTMCHVYVEETK